MISKSILKEIECIAGREHLMMPGDGLEEYASDATRLESMPDAVVFPGTAGEVSRILRLATEKGFPVIPRGAGSGMSGGAVPVKGGLVMAMKRFDSINEVDEENLICRVEPGVITAHLQEAVERVGLFYPPDPASLNISTIGGNVAECAGGLRAVKYGVTRDYVLGLTAVLPTGEILKTGVETMKGVAGYDLTRLIIGSEGTLAVITSVTLKLIPKPIDTKTVIAFFPDVSTAVRAVSEIIRNKIIPTVAEFMDRMCLGCVKDKLDISIPSTAGAMLLIEVDGDEYAIEKNASDIRRICEGCSALRFISAGDKKEADRLWEARREASPSLYDLRPHKVSEDVVIPRSKMGELVSFLDDMGRRYDLPIAAFGHAGDGNLHVNIMHDRNRSGELEKVEAAVKDLFNRVLQLGGTITGEHGIGITKAPYLEMEISRAGLELMGRIKNAFDPKGILNPGKIFI